MSKLVVLELDGNFQEGFRITLEIYREETRPSSTPNLPARLKSQLPANSELPQILHRHWQEKYRSLGAPYRRKQRDDRTFRIKPQKIVHRKSRDRQVEECRNSARELRSSLNQWLDSREFRPIEQQLRSHLQPEEEIRFLIRTENRQLQKLPWEEWELFQHYPHAETALSPTELQVRESFFPPRRGTQVRILAILGHSEGIDIERDRRLLEALPHAEVIFLVSPPRSAVTDKIWENAWDIIFFAGHSETEGETGRIYLNEKESLSIDELWFGLKKAVDHGLQLAIFNSCDGLGLSDRLDDLQIPQMIVMRELVPDLVAQKFLTYFLGNFSTGHSFYRAVQEAKQRLHDELEKDFPCASWLPVICQTPNAVPPTWESLREEETRATIQQPERINSPIPASDRRLAIVLSFLVAGLVMGVRSLGWLQGWELNHFDFMMRSRPPELMDDRFLLVTIGERDRTYQDNLGMNRRDSLSPEALEILWQKVKPHQPRVIALNIHDFAYDLDINRDFVEHSSFLATCQSLNLHRELEAISPSLKLSENRLGFSRFNIDPDGIVRRQALAKNPSSTCNAPHSLSLQIAQKYLQLQAESLPNFPHRGRLGKVKFTKLTETTGSYQLPKTAVGAFQILINYRSTNPYQISLSDLLSGTLDAQLADLVTDKIILVGSNAEGNDASYTPYRKGFWHEGVPSIVIHAQMASQLISAVLDNRPLLQGIPQWLENLNILIGSFLGFVLVGYKLKLLHKIIIFVSISGILFILSYQGLVFGIWIPILPIAFSLTLSTLFVTFFHHSSEIL